MPFTYSIHSNCYTFTSDEATRCHVRSVSFSSSIITMLLKILIFFFFCLRQAAALDSSPTAFTFYGLDETNLTTDGWAAVASDGLLQLTNNTPQCKGHAFFSSPVRFRANKGNHNRPILSFSTTFVFAIVPFFPNSGTMGMAFVISPTKQLSSGAEGIYLGIFNSTNNGSNSNHILSLEFSDIKNTVSINVNGQAPLKARGAAYYDPGSSKIINISLVGGEPIQAWFDYDSGEMELNVTMYPLNMSGTVKMDQRRPLLSTKVDLTDVILDEMFVGFSAVTGVAPTSHYVLGWSFQMNGESRLLDLFRLPKLPIPNVPNRKSLLWTILLPFVVLVVLVLIVAAVVVVMRRKRKYAEVLEDWEVEYGPHRFSYRDLYKATNGFKDSELLGVGGFGKVYKGVMPKSKSEVAVKRISHDSKQGIKEFVSEVVSIGRLRHRNLVQLLGYCRRMGELLLVYDYMPNGSLDKILFEKTNTNLSWDQRFQIIKGIASALLYLHEGWEQLVIHRDVKASNVLLDGDLNGRLGDFGLARLYDHGTHPQTTHVVGTMGFIAPELARTGKATRATDVFAFGVFLIEVACGRRPIESKKTSSDEIITLDWVLSNWTRGSLLSSLDSNMVGNYSMEEVELVLKLGLLCSHSSANARPSMRQVMQMLDGDLTLPELSPEYWKDCIVSMRKNESFDEYLRSNPSISATTGNGSFFISGGR